MKLIALPAFNDNRIRTFCGGRETVVVDPDEPAPAIEALDARRLALAAILVTRGPADEASASEWTIHRR